jgi:hypothetical protein
MRAMEQLSGQELHWVPQGARTRSFELRADEEPVATLTRAKGASALAEAADGCWTFTRSGFWHPAVQVQETGGAREAALFSARWTGTGTLKLQDGRRFHWGAANVWQSQWAWQAPDGASLLRIARQHCVRGARGTVEIAPDARFVRELSLLALLGWYLVLLHAQDGDAAAAGIIAAIG